MHLITGGCVVVAVGLERMNKANVIHVSRHVGKQFADPHPVLAVLRKLERAGHQLRFATVKDIGEFRRLDSFLERVRYRFAVEFLQFRFVVERVNVRRPADHVEENHRLRLGREMRQARSEGVERINQGTAECGLGASVLTQQRAKRQRAKSCTGANEKIAP